MSLIGGVRRDSRVSVIVTNCTEPAKPASLNEPIPDTALINGGNCWDCSSNLTEKCAGGRFEAVVGERGTYRLRVVNVGAFLPLMFSVEGHQMRIIEADGNDVNTSYNQPQASQCLAVGQRLSLGVII